MSAPALNTLNNNKGLGQLNGFLANKSFIEGYSLSQADVAYANALATADVSKFKHVERFLLHVAQFSKAEQAKFPAAPSAAVAVAAEEEEDSDEGDLFGSDSDEDDEAVAAAAAKRAEAAKAAQKKKAPPAGRSTIVFDVKVWEADQDLDALAAKIKSEVVMEGLTWAPAVSKVPLAFGIFKLQVMCTVFDDLVPTTEMITDPIEAMENDVQSVDIFAFNKV